VKIFLISNFGTVSTLVNNGESLTITIVLNDTYKKELTFQDPTYCDVIPGNGDTPPIDTCEPLRKPQTIQVTLFRQNEYDPGLHTGQTTLYFGETTQIRYRVTIQAPEFATIHHRTLG
jgi:hypothetical protein